MYFYLIAKDHYDWLIRFKELFCDIFRKLRIISEKMLVLFGPLLALVVTFRANELVSGC
jgi:hypothetical protein